MRVNGDFKLINGLVDLLFDLRRICQNKLYSSYCDAYNDAISDYGLLGLWLAIYLVAYGFEFYW